MYSNSSAGFNDAIWTHETDITNMEIIHFNLLSSFSLPGGLFMEMHNYYHAII